MKARSIAIYLVALLVLASSGSVNAVSHVHEATLRTKVHSDSVQALLYHQQLDHYDHQDGRTWVQRYWIDEKYWSGAAAGGPIFLYLGNEGPEDEGIVTSTQMTLYAQTHKALQVGIEHRFYGDSQPFSHLTTSNLKYLSSQQALADAAEIILEVQAKYKAYNSPIITFGCSYSGSLATYFRMKYPHVTLGAVGSSGPVEAIVDFYQYMEVVDRSLKYFVGPECGNIIRQATEKMQTLLSTSSGASQLQQLFTVCTPLIEKKDITTFMSVIMENWQGEVQYNLQRGYNVSTKCIQLTQLVHNGASALDAYAEVNNGFLKTQCLDPSYGNMIKKWRDEKTSNSMRAWWHQVCTEFGYLQTAEDRNFHTQPFGNMIPLSYWEETCRDTFDIDLDLARRIKETNQHYGGFKLPTFVPNNMLFVNHDIDPWHVLSIYKPIANSPIETVFVTGTSHCADLRVIGDKAPPQLLAAQAQISNSIGKWLAAYKPVPHIVDHD